MSVGADVAVALAVGFLGYLAGHLHGWNAGRDHAERNMAEMMRKHRR